MRYDCAIIGGGPAGLNAALVLGRARKSTALFDDNKPRNGVTHASHGFITRDGVKPEEFRRIAYEEVTGYPSVRHYPAEVVSVRRTEEGFELTASTGETVKARKVILSGGLKDTYPEIEGFRDFYGKSLFVCPFCDGWEMRDKPLAVVSSHPAAFHVLKLLYQNWSRDLVLCTNGSGHLTAEQREKLEARGIRIVDTPVASFAGSCGLLERITFADGTSIERSGGFVAPVQTPSGRFAEELGYEVGENGEIVTGPMGTTTAAGVFAAGDAAYVMPSQLIYAAASGSKAAMSAIGELTEEDWEAHD
ncbi:NAD(P)/FAD-dependent oxidoreductase [Cohnella fermenti]|uniref:NAD(P)/FAD-dependent oxidoreductase n=1 Tax=Cohnella fermenti TaxID=2565925 RepID=A0A4S4BRX8_9BACL|nr:NAD(P)/FAD-dependent oxidoreductase [Cohnella fermenti]THF76951.1 NAD(P)/FAD-dependent oxidoreductase [Cohnella fermenti]